MKTGEHHYPLVVEFGRHTIPHRWYDATKASRGATRRLHPEWKIVIHAFFDDSGGERDPQSRFSCLAGYLAHETYWTRFQDYWRHLLLRHGLPYLHMREYVKIANDRGWGTVHRNSVVLEFVQVVKECRLIGFGVGVDAQAWRKLSRDRRAAFGDAQQFCFTRIMRRVVDRLELAQEPEPIQVFFDRDMEYARPRLRFFDHILKFDRRAAERVAALSFADSQWYSPLQAADMLAWETRKHLIARADKTPSSQRFGELLTALPWVDLEYAAGEYWDQDEIDREFPKIEAEHEAAKASASTARAAERSSA
jgi:hypothetical protein